MENAKDEIYMNHPQCKDCSHWSADHWQCSEIEYHGMWYDVEAVAAKDRLIVVWDNQFEVDVGPSFGCRRYDSTQIPNLPFDPVRVCANCCLRVEKNIRGCKMIVDNTCWQYDAIPHKVWDRDPQDNRISCYFGSRFEIWPGLDFGCVYWTAPMGWMYDEKFSEDKKYWDTLNGPRVLRDSLAKNSGGDKDERGRGKA